MLCLFFFFCYTIYAIALIVDEMMDTFWLQIEHFVVSLNLFWLCQFSFFTYFLFFELVNWLDNRLRNSFLAENLIYTRIIIWTQILSFWEMLWCTKQVIINRVNERAVYLLGPNMDWVRALKIWWWSWRLSFRQGGVTQTTWLLVICEVPIFILAKFAWLL